jgi:hypothetical protein
MMAEKIPIPMLKEIIKIWNYFLLEIITAGSTIKINNRTPNKMKILHHLEYFWKL